MANEKQIENLVGLLDGYAEKGGHHLNVNVLNREILKIIPSLPSAYPDTLSTSSNSPRNSRTTLSPELSTLLCKRKRTETAKLA